MLMRTHFNLFCCLSDQHQFFYFSVKCINPLIICGLLIITASDQKRWTVHRTDSLNSGIRVGSLGIVVKTDPSFFGHILDPVFYRLETLQHLHDFLHRHSEIHTHGSCGHDIFIVMSSQQIQIIDIDHFLGVSVMRIKDFLSVEIKSFSKFSCTAEPDHMHRCALSECPKHFILIIKHTDLILCLIGGDCLFGLNITIHGVMTVQMIRRNI